MSTMPVFEQFQMASKIENHLSTVADILLGLACLAETIGAEQARVVQRLSWIASQECEAIREINRALFQLAHPNRQHFEKEGWPT